MQDNSGKIIGSIKPAKIILPILLGLAVTFFLFWKEFDAKTFTVVNFGYFTIFWAIISLGMMALRDFGYMMRIKLLSDNQLTWKQSFNVVMLWEFTSAITPSAVGGTSVAIFFVCKEGISVGRSTAIVMVTSFLDELYFIFAFPLVLLAINYVAIFSYGEEVVASSIWYNNFFLVALLGYSLKFAYVLLISYGLFINPRGLKWLLLWIFKLPIIRKWRPHANNTGTDLIETSREFKRKPPIFWLKAFGSTALSWTSRYWVANALILAFFGSTYLGWNEHWVVFGKQLVMWIIMLVTPTPGGSGFAEYVFTTFMSGIIPAGIGVALAFSWRMVSYYPYLIIGTFVVPRWIRLKFMKNE